jgi:hypothetical protein
LGAGLYNLAMTQLLKQAFDKISEELPDSEQDRIAQALIDLVEGDDVEWDALLAKNPDKLRKMADRALEDYLAGRTTVLDLKKL